MPNGNGKEERWQEALARATGGTALSNYPAIVEGFISKGMEPGEVKPRVNVFTYAAWKALGRQVRRGEHGVKVLTYIEGEKTETDEEGKEKTRSFRRPRTTTVFHLTQTDPR